MIKDLGREEDTEVIPPLFCARRRRSWLISDLVALSISKIPTIPSMGIVLRLPISKNTFSSLNLRISTFFNPKQPLSLKLTDKVFRASGDDDLTVGENVQKILASVSIQLA